MAFNLLKEEKLGGDNINYFYAGAFFFFFLMIVFGEFPAFSHTRWATGLDINGDGLFNVTDCAKWVLWIFNMPGDILIQSLLTFETTTSFFEITVDSYGDGGSMLFSLVYWNLTGGKKMVIFWLVLLILVMLKNAPPIPFLY